MINNTTQEKSQLISEIYQLRKENEILKQRLDQIKHVVLHKTDI